MAEALVSAFQVDALYNISGTAAVDTFIKEFPHLRWPDYRPQLFVDGMKGKEPTLLDVRHPAQHLYRAHVDGRIKPSIEAVLYQWSIDDALRYVLLASCGGYPLKDEIGRDYNQLFGKALAAQVRNLGRDDEIPNDLHRHLTPNILTSINLEPDLLASPRAEPGFYHGDALDFTDLVNFWNLRACNIDIFFYDPNLAGRLAPFTKAWSQLIHDRPKRNDWLTEISVWGKDPAAQVDLSPFGAGVLLCTMRHSTWNGLNLNPPVMGFEPKSTLGAAAEDQLGTSVTFQVPEKPFFSDFELHSQMVVASISAGNIDNALLTPPFIPQLNEYYGHHAYFLPNKVRAERGSLGIILRVTEDQLTIRALPFTDIVCKTFEAFGMKAHPSAAGLVGARLIEQMGGLQGCRVFKIVGVRSLIKKYPPVASFERTEAVTVIGDNDPVTHLPRFDAYASLFIEPRDKMDLKPEDAFMYLLKRGVFRAGLKLTCPTCQLDFWVHLDEVKSSSKCVYCGKEFNVLLQLRDRNWAYRRSGLFGREDNQSGGIPVALTLQQLETALLGHTLLYTTGIELNPDSAPIEKCETDLVLLVSSFPHSEKPLQLVIGECKDRGGEISEDDVRKLTKAAQALEKSPCQVFILFSKCGQFTPEEIERCKGARRKLFEDRGQTYYVQNVIMLSESELEPYHLYERTEREFDINRTAISLEDLAQVTDGVFFNPKRKPQP
ncbi:MAG: hypothetical protein LAO04_11495 [Acidobacteriia bacterium]|nr:hypothetical protein [Terriglobia bacterium]